MQQPKLNSLTGYAHPYYAKSLAEFGEPRQLPCSGGWLLERGIPNSSDRDAMGCYPLFVANNWRNLNADLTALGERLVSLALVTDPFGEYSLRDLESCFDIVNAFKQHYVIDFSKPLSISRHHSYYARKASEQLSVETETQPEGFSAEWTELYESLVQRHRIRGIKAFSKAAFELQLRIPGAIVFRALERGTLVGAHIWYQQQDFAYSHLAAATDRGYELSCSYAIHSAAIEHFRSKVEWLDLGGGAGAATSREMDGLTRFKSGWSNSTRAVYFCGRVLNRERYETLTLKFNARNTSYFPAYRSGELG